MKEYGDELITSQNTPFIEQFHTNAALNAYDRPSIKENNKDQKQRDHRLSLKRQLVIQA